MGKNQPKPKRNDLKTLGVLFEISEAVTATSNLYELYKVIHKSLGKILNVNNFYIALHHEEKDSITFPYHVDEKDEIPDEILNFSETASLTGKVIESRQPMIFLEKDIIDFAKKKKKEIIGTIDKIWLGSPLIIKERIIGVVAIHSFTSSKDYNKKDLDLLNNVSRHIALAIERKESEKKLKEHQQLFESIIESSPVGICYMEKRVFKWVNGQMVKILRYDSKDDFTNKSVGMIYESDKEYAEAGHIINESLFQRKKADFDFMLKRKDGSLIKANIILTSIGKTDSLENTIAIITDISQNDLLRKEKLENERLQGVLEMAGAICNEIKKPFQNIVESSSRIDSYDSINSSALEKIKKQASNIGKITKRLANITRYKTVFDTKKSQIISDIWVSNGEQ